MTIDDFIPKSTPRKKSEKKFKVKSDNLILLQKKYLEHKRTLHPDLPFPTPKIFSENNANHLTESCIWWVRVHGGSADRINNGAVYDPRRKVFRKGGTRKGIADIIGVFRGKYLAIEVKFGKDRQSADQKSMQAEIEAAGGIYILARTFDQFVEEFSRFME